MIMVIFGAGASYDSAPDFPPNEFKRHYPQCRNRPPLATELFLNDGIFSDSLKRFPQCNPIIPYLRSVPKGRTIEEVLGMLQAEGESDPERKRQI
jgi:hypothetical protein